MNSSTAASSNLGPRCGTWLTPKVLKPSREHLLQKLDAAAKSWEDSYQASANTQDIIGGAKAASMTAISNAYLALTAFARPDHDRFTLYDYTQHTLAQENVKEANEASRISEAALQDLDEYKSLAMLSQFAAQAASSPIRFTEASHDLAGTFWSLYGQVSCRSSVDFAG